MKISQYNNLVKVDENVYLLYNILYQNIVAVSMDSIDTVNGLLNAGKAHPDNKLYNLLVKGGFLVDDDLNELDYIKYKYFQHLFSKDKLHLILIPTLTCNFGCVYCKQRLQDKTYSEDVIRKIIKYVAGVMPQRRKLDIAWFGGEPLLCKQQIYNMTREFQDICRKTQSRYTASLCTNGSLLKGDFARDIDSLGIKSIQITIDGPPEWHNKLRPFISGGDSFDVLRENIENFARMKNKVSLTLRVNISDDSYAHALDLLDEFSDTVRKRVNNLYFRFIMTTEAKNNKKFVEKMSMAQSWELYHKSLQKGWNAKPPEVSKLFREDRFYYCDEADYLDSFYVGPEGGFYKCSESFYPLGKEAVGYLNKQGNLDINRMGAYLKFIMNLPFDEQCKDCLLLPMHLGGCKLNCFKNKKKCVADKDIYIQQIAQFIYNYKKIKYNYKIAGKKYRILKLNEMK